MVDGSHQVDSDIFFGRSSQYFIVDKLEDQRLQKRAKEDALSGS